MLRSRAIVSLIVLLFCIGPFAQAPASLNRLVPLLVQADGAAVASNPEVWPGFIYEQYPIFIWEAESSSGLLAHVELAPPGFTPADPAHADILWGPIPTDTKPEAGVVLAGRLTAWIPVAEVSAQPGTGMMRLFEGAFSIFAQYRGMTLPNPSLGNEYPVVDAENNSLSRAENLLLIRMLSMSDVQLKPHMAAFLDLRSARQGRLSEDHRKYENSMEIFQGLQKYAGMKVEGGDTRAAMADMAAKLDRFNREGFGAETERWAYTGCALGLILDRMAPGWKLFFEKTARDSFLPVIENSTLETSPADLSFLNIPQLKAEEKAAADRILSEKQALVDSIAVSPGLVVTVDLRTVLALGSIKWDQRAAPNGVTKITPKRIVQSEYYALSAAGVMEFISSRPVIIDVGEKITLSFPDLKKVLVTIDGQKPEFGEGEIPVIGSLDIRGEEFQLVAERAQVTYSNRLLNVEILPKPEFMQ